MYYTKLWKNSLIYLNISLLKFIENNTDAYFFILVLKKQKMSRHADRSILENLVG
jgi:hypothetical protein